MVLRGLGSCPQAKISLGYTLKVLSGGGCACCLFVFSEMGMRARVFIVFNFLLQLHACIFLLHDILGFYIHTAPEKHK